MSASSSSAQSCQELDNIVEDAKTKYYAENIHGKPLEDINAMLLGDVKTSSLTWLALLHKWQLEDATYEEIYEYALMHGYIAFNKIIGDKISVPDRNMINMIMTKAAYYGHIKSVELMITKGANEFNIGMLEATRGQHIGLIKIFIAWGANCFDDGMYEAAKIGDEKLVKFYISCGADDFDFGMRGASKGGSTKMIKFFLDKGADNIEHCCNAAAKYGQLEAFQLLMESCMGISATTIYYAGYGGNMDIIKTVIDRTGKMAIDCADILNSSCIQGAAEAGHLEVIEYFLPVVSHDPRSIINATIDAIKNGHLAIIKYLYENLDNFPLDAVLRNVTDSQRENILYYLRAVNNN